MINQSYVKCFSIFGFYLQVNARDIFIDKNDNIQARIYVPKHNNNNNSLLPIVVYFHGGGFCMQENLDGKIVNGFIWSGK